MTLKRLNYRTGRNACLRFHRHPPPRYLPYLSSRRRSSVIIRPLTSLGKGQWPRPCFPRFSELDERRPVMASPSTSQSPIPSVRFAHSISLRTVFVDSTLNGDGHSAIGSPEGLVRAWEGSTIFSDVVPRHQPIIAVRSVEHLAESSPPAVVGPSMTPQRVHQATGNASSPISVSSGSPSPLSRPRAKIAYTSPLPRTAFTPPRPLRKPLTPPRVTLAPRPLDVSDRNGSKEVHPFFDRDFRRTKSAPTRAPPSQKPRLVAHYSSTSASASTSQSTSQSLPDDHQRPRQSEKSTRPNKLASRKGKEKMDDGDRRSSRWAVGGRKEIQLVTEKDLTSSDSEHSQGAASEREALYEERVTEDEVRKLAELMLDLDFSPSKTPRPKKPVSSKLAQRRQPLGPAKISKPDSDLPEYLPLPSAKILRAKTPPPSDLPLYSYKFSDPIPQVVYTSNVEEANDLLSCLSGEVLGFDMEWPRAGQKDEKGKVLGRIWNDDSKQYTFKELKTALLQFCDDKMIVLVHLWHMKSRLLPLRKDRSRTYTPLLQACPPRSWRYCKMKRYSSWASPSGVGDITFARICETDPEAITRSRRSQTTSRSSCEFPQGHLVPSRAVLHGSESRSSHHWTR